MVLGSDTIALKNKINIYSNSNFSSPYIQTVTGLGDKFGVSMNDGSYVSADASIGYNSVNQVGKTWFPYLKSAPKFTPVLRGLVASVGGSVGTNLLDEGWTANVSGSKDIGLANMQRGSLSSLGDPKILDGSTFTGNLGYRFSGGYNTEMKMKNASTEFGVFGYRKAYDNYNQLNQSSLGLYAKILTDNLYITAQTGIDPLAPKTKVSGGVGIGLTF